MKHYYRYYRLPANLQVNSCDVRDSALKVTLAKAFHPYGSTPRRIGIATVIHPIGGVDVAHTIIGKATMRKACAEIGWWETCEGCAECCEQKQYTSKYCLPCVLESPVFCNPHLAMRSFGASLVMVAISTFMSVKYLSMVR